MHILPLVTFGWLFQITISAGVDEIEPGQCVSKFDYDFKVMQTLLKLEQEVAALREKLQKIEQSINELETVEKDKKTFLSESNITELTQDDHLIAFEAQLSSNMVNPVMNTVVVFDDVLTNINNDYKPNSGVFIATKPGVYNFHLVATSATKSSGSLLHLYMMHNDKRIGYIFLDGNSGFYLIRSTNAVVTLKARDTVFVKIGKIISSGTLNGSGFHTHFSGFRIGEE